MKNSEEDLLGGIKATDVIEYEESVQSEVLKKAWHKDKLRNWKGKNMHGMYLRDMPDTTDVVGTWEWLRKADLKVQTEAQLCAAQEQTFRTNSVKHHIDKMADSPLCRLGGEKVENVDHVVSGCKTLAQKEYKRRHWEGGPLETG